jgi:hypothetical protein
VARSPSPREEPEALFVSHEEAVARSPSFQEEAVPRTPSPQNEAVTKPPSPHGEATASPSPVPM